MEKISFKSAFNNSKNLYLWRPKGEVRAVMQIVHGMAEHIERYDDFANFMCGNGIAVAGFNLQGHGNESQKLGFFEKEEGYKKILEDIHKVRENLQTIYPNLPYILLGHSMGSTLARLYILSYPHPDMLILSGAGTVPPLLANMAKFLAKTLCMLGKGDKPSKFLDRLAFDAYNKKYENPKTKFDWLSRDEDEVKKYIDDPYCGFLFTSAGFRDLGLMFVRLNKSDAYEISYKQMPIYMFSGDMDPVGGFSKGTRYVYEQYKKAGIPYIKLKLYENGRHEMLNEINKNEVYKDVLSAVNEML